MKKLPRLPAPQKNASNALAIFGAAFDFFTGTSIGTIGSEFAKNAMSKRLNDAREILLEQIRGGDFSDLSDELYSELIPMGFKFFRASIEGASKQKIRLLARLIHGAIGAEDGAGIFDLISEKLAGLSDLDLELIANIFELRNKGIIKNQNFNGVEMPYVHASLLVENSKFTYVDAYQSLANLNFCGFIIEKTEITWDMTEAGYYLGKYFLALCELALADR